MVLLLFIVPKVMVYLSGIVMQPVVLIEDWLETSTGALPVYLRERTALLEAQRALEQKLAESSGARYTIDQLQLENEALRELLGASSMRRIGAGVIGRPTELPYDVLVIDRGEKDGVKKHAPVFIGHSQAVGFVAEVFSDTAVVALVTTPDISSTVYIYGPNIYTTAVGMGGGVLRVSVPQGIALNEGDVVVMPSFATGIYGQISVIESVPTRPEQYGYVSIDTPLSSVRYVSVGEAPLSVIDFDTAKTIVETVREDLLTVPVPAGVLIDTLATSTATSTIISTSTERL